MFVSGLLVLFTLPTAASFAKHSNFAANSFEHYVSVYGREYGAPDSQEYIDRRNVFEDRLERVAAQNARESRLWTAGLNHLTDRTAEELERLRGWKRGAPGHTGVASFISERTQKVKALASSVNWSNLTTLSTAKDQGNCGSCWAVATVNMLEGHNEIRTGKARKLSVQQLVDCVPNKHECGGEGGCKGATIELAMAWVKDNGLADDADVAYTATDGVCTVKESTLVDRAQKHAKTKKHVGGSDLGLVSFETLPSNQAKPLMEALMAGPVAVSVGAEDGWFMYQSGVYDACSKDSVINHAVLMVGYGGKTKSKYWTIQNSWGPYYGEKGHIRLLRHDTSADDDAFCGTDNKPGDGIACKPYPDSVEVCGMCGVLYDSVSPGYE